MFKMHHGDLRKKRKNQQYELPKPPSERHTDQRRFGAWLRHPLVRTQAPEAVSPAGAIGAASPVPAPGQSTRAAPCREGGWGLGTEPASGQPTAPGLGTSQIEGISIQRTAGVWQRCLKNLQATTPGTSGVLPMGIPSFSSVEENVSCQTLPQKPAPVFQVTWFIAGKRISTWHRATAPEVSLCKQRPRTPGSCSPRADVSAPRPHTGTDWQPERVRESSRCPWAGVAPNTPWALESAAGSGTTLQNRQKALPSGTHPAPAAAARPATLLPHGTPQPENTGQKVCVSTSLCWVET